MERWLVKGDAALQASVKRQLQALDGENRVANGVVDAVKKPKVSALTGAVVRKSSVKGVKRAPLVALDDDHEAAKSIASSLFNRLYSKPKSATNEAGFVSAAAVLDLQAEDVTIQAPASPCADAEHGTEQQLPRSVSATISDLCIATPEDDSAAVEAEHGANDGVDADADAVAETLSGLPRSVFAKPMPRLPPPSKMHLPNFMHTDRGRATLTCKRMRPSKVRFDCSQYAATRSEVTHIAFDPFGVLFAVASGDGLIRVYDFDDFLRFERSELVEHPRSMMCEPVVVCRAAHSISHVAWLSENELCCAFAFRQGVNVYDLQNGRTDPSTVLTDGAVTQGGNAALCVLGPNKVAAAGTDGKIRMWNTSAPDRPVWRVDVPDRLMGIQLLGDNVLACVGRLGGITYWDTARMTSQAFGVKPAPSKIGSMDVSACIPLSTGPVCGVAPHGATQAVITFDSVICLVELVRQEVLSVFERKRANPVLVDPTLPLELQQRSIHPAQLDSPVAAILVRLPRTRSDICCWSGGSGTALAGGQPDSAYSVQFVDMSGCRNATQQSGAPTLRFVATSNFDFTLPGCVRQAEFGVETVYVTHDLRPFLAPRRAATLLLHKTCRVQIGGVEYEVVAVTADSVTLSTPYGGPAVQDSLPKIIMRASLRPQVQQASSAESNDVKELHAVGLEAKATVLTCHPELPYVIVGSDRHRLTVLTTVSDKDDP